MSENRRQMKESRKQMKESRKQDADIFVIMILFYSIICLLSLMSPYMSV